MSKPKKAPKKKATDPRTQGQRFMDFARDHGADDPKALERAIGEDAERLRKPKPKD